MTNLNQSELVSLIEKALEVEPGKVSKETKAKDIEKWDSLGHLSILVALDKHYDGKVSGIHQIATADSVSKIAELLQEKSLLNS
tara:strand:+ start:94 stop:345 length:252 start_codon:yes stop_codon:yes gene_type:complete